MLHFLGIIVKLLGELNKLLPNITESVLNYHDSSQNNTFNLSYHCASVAGFC